MAAAIWRLLALLALALMPFGMAPAAAVPSHHEAAAASDCADHGSQPDERSAHQANCAAACSMLIFGEAPVGEPGPLAMAVLIAGPAVQLSGLHPEAATPPPRRA